MQTTPLKTAVVIPLFNGERWIAQTLESVFAQTRPADEVVVVDDGSKDRSVEIVRRHSNTRLLFSPKPASRMARDHGAEHTSAPLITFLDQDDVWAPTHLERLAGILEREPAAVAVAATSVPFREDAELTFCGEEPLRFRALDLWANFPFGTVPATSLVLMRRAAFNRAGRWAGQTPTMGDLELWLRMAMEGEFLCSDTVTIGRRVHSQSYSSSMRARCPSTYLQALENCAGVLAAERLRRHPEEDALLHRRLQLARKMKAFGVLFTEGKRGRVAEAVRTLEGLLQSETPAFRTVAWANLWWFLAPSIRSWDRRRRATRLHMDVKDQCGEFAALLWSSMVKWPESFFALQMLAPPFKKHRDLFQAALAEKNAQAKAPPRYHGDVDEDGWVKKRGSIRVPIRKGSQAVQIQVEMPPWSGLAETQLTLSSNGEALAAATLPPGRHQITVACNDPGTPLVLSFQLSDEFEIPGDGRLRALRIVRVEQMEQPPFGLPDIRRWRP